MAKQWGRIDFLLNDAGASNAKGILEIKEEEFDRTIAVNLKSCFNYVHAIAPDHAEAGEWRPHRQHASTSSWHSLRRPSPASSPASTS